MVGVRMLFAFVIIVFQLLTLQGGAQQHSKVATVSVSTPEAAMRNQYLVWADKHPSVWQKSPTLVISVPFISLYSPTGVSVYYGTDSKTNTAFIRALAHNVPPATNASIDTLRPTLKEYMDMVAELQPYERLFSTKRAYTLFAVSYDASACCKAQNEAIRYIKNRGSRIDLRVIEVRLNK
jgi:hypothetical protein